MYEWFEKHIISILPQSVPGWVQNIGARVQKSLGAMEHGCSRTWVQKTLGAVEHGCNRTGCSKTGCNRTWVQQNLGATELGAVEWVQQNEEK